MRRVLVVLHDAADGGAGRAVARLHDRLADRGFELEYWVPGPGRMQDALSAAGRTAHPCARPIRYSRAALAEPPGAARRVAAVPAYLRGFARRLAAGRYDLVHANTLLALPEALVSKRNGVRAILHAHEMLPPGAKGRVAAAGARRADAVVAVSHAAATALAAHGVEARVVHNGVEPPPTPASCGGDPPVVGALGTVCARKGSDVFVDVARRVGAPARFRLAGPAAAGPEAAWAEALLGRAGRAGVECPGRVDGGDALGGLDVLVVPSRQDPFPLVVLEGMASGLPVVASAVDGIPEQLGDGAGVLVPPGDAEATARAVESLLADPALRQRLGRTARARARSVFTLERQADGLASAYEEALA